MEVGDGKVKLLDFGDDTVELAPGDAVILAVPASVARLMLPDLDAPETFRAIVNAHFKIAPPKDFPRLLGIVNGTAEWLFAFPDRISVTISARRPLRRDLSRGACERDLGTISPR